MTRITAVQELTYRVVFRREDGEPPWPPLVHGRARYDITEAAVTVRVAGGDFDAALPEVLQARRLLESGVTGPRIGLGDRKFYGGLRASDPATAKSAQLREAAVGEARAEHARYLAAAAQETTPAELAAATRAALTAGGYAEYDRLSPSTAPRFVLNDAAAAGGVTVSADWRSPARPVRVAFETLIREWARLLSRAGLRAAVRTDCAARIHVTGPQVTYPKPDPEFLAGLDEAKEAVAAWERGEDHGG
jgi:hypothetical protein